MSEEQNNTEELENKTLAMSDEDIAKMSINDFKVEDTKEGDIPESGSDPAIEEEPEEPVDPESTEEEEEETPEVASRQSVYSGDGTEEEEEPEEEPEDEEELAAEPTGKAEQYESDGVDYKSEYEKLLAPMRASKREISVRNVDEARQLMQMGFDYANKMRSIKPHLKIIKALEANNLLDPSKISFYIDLDKKNPEAIKKFLKDKEIDPMELDTSEDHRYQPRNYTPSDKEFELDLVLDEIRSTESFQRTLDEIGNNWDTESKKFITENPQLIKVINDQIGNGIYDQIMNVVETERLLGRLQGMNDLAAYKTVGDAIQSKGGFAHLQTETKPKAQKTVQRDRAKLRERKRAASPTKATPAKKKADIHVLDMPDDKFDQLMAEQRFG